MVWDTIPNSPESPNGLIKSLELLNSSEENGLFPNNSLYLQTPQSPNPYSTPITSPSSSSPSSSSLSSSSTSSSTLNSPVIASYATQKHLEKEMSSKIQKNYLTENSPSFPITKSFPKKQIPDEFLISCMNAELPIIRTVSPTSSGLSPLIIDNSINNSISLDNNKIENLLNSDYCKKNNCDNSNHLLQKTHPQKITSQKHEFKDNFENNNKFSPDINNSPENTNNSSLNDNDYTTLKYNQFREGKTIRKNERHLEEKIKNQSNSLVERNNSKNLIKSPITKIKPTKENGSEIKDKSNKITRQKSIKSNFDRNNQNCFSNDLIFGERNFSDCLTCSTPYENTHFRLSDKDKREKWIKPQLCSPLNQVENKHLLENQIFISSSSPTNIFVNKSDIRSSFLNEQGQRHCKLQNDKPKNNQTLTKNQQTATNDKLHKKNKKIVTPTNHKSTKPQKLLFVTKNQAAADSTEINQDQDKTSIINSTAADAVDACNSKCLNNEINPASTCNKTIIVDSTSQRRKSCEVKGILATCKVPEGIWDKPKTPYSSQMCKSQRTSETSTKMFKKGRRVSEEKENVSGISGLSLIMPEKDAPPLSSGPMFFAELCRLWPDLIVR